MIIRLYTGEDGQSHVEELKMPSGEATSVALKAGADMTFHHNPEGHLSDWHNAPRRQYVIFLSGQTEIRLGDGTTRHLSPGSMLLAEDLTGKGHTARALAGACLSVSMPLP